MAGKKRKQQTTQRHLQPLSSDFDTSSVSSSKKRSRPPKLHQQEHKLISSDLSSKILKEALNQQKEILEEETQPQTLTSFSSIPPNHSIASDSGAESDDDVDAFDGFSETLSHYDAPPEEIDEEDEKVLAAFMSKDAGPQRTLADLIIQRIKEKDAQVTSEVRPLPKLNSAIIDIYKGVGKLLCRYTTGKLPKAFKRVPSLEVWEDVLYLTEPEKWTPNAMFQATRIFSSNLGVKKAQCFYNLVLLPRVRDDILKNKKLHFSLYQALIKSLYKPAAFFKGMLLPLCQSGTRSLREAVIFGSVIQKASIPPLHSSAALMKLAEMEYCGTTSYFIKLFPDKKYALPYRVLDAVVDHFMRFLEDSRIMTVIWHQSLLAFVWRYKNELTKVDKDNLYHLIQYQKHHLVTPEIRRELSNSRNCGEMKDDLMSMASPISVVNKTIEEDRWDFPVVPMEEDYKTWGTSYSAILSWASEFPREYDGACLQMRMSYSPAAHLFLFLVQWTDCSLAGALGLLRVLLFLFLVQWTDCSLAGALGLLRVPIYKVYVDGTTTLTVHERKASIKEFYAVIFPSLLQLQSGITDMEDRKQKAVCMERYRRRDDEERRQYSEVDAEREEECGICMELNSKIVLPNCIRAMCVKCCREWHSRS